MATAQAIEANHCQPIIDDCKDALNKADGIISDQTKIIELQDKELEITKSNLQQAIEYGDQQKQLANVWYHDPMLVIPASILAGFLIGEVVGKK